MRGGAMKIKLKDVLTIVLVILCVGALIVVAKLSNNFTTDIKTFYVKVDGKIVTERGSFKLNNNRFEVCNVVNKVTGEATEYTYKVVANTAVNMPTFIVDGKKVSFADIEDLTNLFEFEQTDKGFILKTTTVKNMLKTMYNAEVIDVPSGYDSTTELFSIVITNDDKSIVCDFSVPLGIIVGVTLDKTEIVF